MAEAMEMARDAIGLKGIDYKKTPNHCRNRQVQRKYFRKPKKKRMRSLTIQMEY